MSSVPAIPAIPEPKQNSGEFKPAVVESTNYKFGIGTVVFHLKKKSRYVIVATPDKVVITISGETAYIYADYLNMDKLYVRSRQQMEDGRFVVRTIAMLNAEKLEQKENIQEIPK